ncbi:DnaA/Hda family protein [Rhodococcus qingshengii]|uniref:DnaA/Hda family protein n=1 Tax=Rhodococcus qingshengii TaxID=334542 RepID=UPI0029436CA0|nr:DnaA/Hda family protein [Rhodococcus qingshengii]WOI85980.1 DnaA/Hda family protein [Rhodococcus qingshengii]
MLNQDYTFDTFRIDKGNRFAYAAAVTVAENPGKPYNPLVIWGPSGTGKTHLLHAIANKTHSLNHWVRTHYTPTHTYRDEFLKNIPRGQEEFRRHYYNLDMLLIDDIQDLAGKQKLEEVFLFTLDRLLTDGKQVVMTCDVAPGELAIEGRRLRQRILSGLIADTSI